MSLKDGDRPGLDRRSALRWIAAAAPVAAASIAAARAADEAGKKPAEEKPPEPPKLSEEGKFRASHEPGLSGPERKRLEKQLPALESALKKLRDFPLPDDVEPDFVFRAKPAPRGDR